MKDYKILSRFNELDESKAMLLDGEVIFVISETGKKKIVRLNGGNVKVGDIISEDDFIEIKYSPVSITDKKTIEISKKTGTHPELIKAMSQLPVDILEMIVEAYKKEKEAKMYAALQKSNFRVGEKTIYKTLTSYGYSMNELHQIHIKLGDIGDLAEYVVSNPKQKGMEDFF